MQRGRGLFLLPQEKGPRKGPFFIVLRDVYHVWGPFCPAGVFGALMWRRSITAFVGGGERLRAIFWRKCPESARIGHELTTLVPRFPHKSP